MSLKLEVTDMAGATVEHSTVNYHLAQPAVWRAAWPSMLWKSETFTVITKSIKARRYFPHIKIDFDELFDFA